MPKGDGAAAAVGDAWRCELGEGGCDGAGEKASAIMRRAGVCVLLGQSFFNANLI